MHPAPIVQNLLMAFGALHFATTRLIEHTARLSPDPAAFAAALKADLLSGIAATAPRNSLDPEREISMEAWHKIIATMFPSPPA